MGIDWKLGALFLPKKYHLNLATNATYVQSFFNKDRFMDDVNLKDNRTPYSPEWLVTSILNFQMPQGFGFQFSANYTDEQFSDELNTVVAAANGRVGKIDSYFTLDASAQYEIKNWNSIVRFSAKNLTNERYIASRRPQGIRVGLPFYWSGGIEVRF